MIRRSRTALTAATVVLLFAPLVGQAPQPAPGQKRPDVVYKAPPSVKELSVVPKGWAPPKTAWGEPDLQGIWSYATLTPLERPLAVGDKATLTPEEIKALETNRWTAFDLEPEKGSVGNYNSIWQDMGRSDGRTSLIVDPPNGRRPPMTPEGQKRVAAKREYALAHPADSWEDLPLALRCISYHGVPPIPSAYGNNYQIFQAPGYVVMYDEELTGARRIPTNGSAHPNKAVELWNGDSRGHWEGNTLVVETTNFRPDAASTNFNGAMGQANMPTYRVIERFTRIAPDLIENRFTVDDPATYTAPWTAVLYMPRYTDGPIYEYSCHEGNASLPAVLAGARAKEKAGEKVRQVGIE